MIFHFILSFWIKKDCHEQQLIPAGISILPFLFFKTVFLFHIRIFHPVHFAHEHIQRSEIVFVRTVKRFINYIHFPRFRMTRCRNDKIKVPFKVPPYFSSFGISLSMVSPLMFFCNFIALSISGKSNRPLPVRPINIYPPFFQPLHCLP